MWILFRAFFIQREFIDGEEILQQQRDNDELQKRKKRMEKVSESISKIDCTVRAYWMYEQIIASPPTKACQGRFILSVALPAVLEDFCKKHVRRLDVSLLVVLLTMT